MRVLMVTPSYFPILGGTETYVQQLTHILNQKKGMHADVMTYNMDSKWSPTNRDEIIKEDGFKVFRVPAYNPRILKGLYHELFNVHVIPKLDFTGEFRNYDIIHFHDDTDVSLPLFSYFVNAPKKSRLLHCHTLPYTYDRYKRNLLLRTLFKKVADLYVGLSKHTLRFLLDLGLPKAKLAILPNAVDTETFRPNDNRKIDNLILFVARIIPTKGLDVLLKALFHLDIQTQVIIIGPVGDQSFFSYVQRLIRKVNDETLHEVTYIGPLYENDLIKWYQKAAIFAAPAIWEHFSISNLEALACGTPVISTPIGATPEVVKDGLNGMLVPPNEPLALASALEKLLKNETLRELYGRRGREIVENFFSWKIVSEKVTEIYRRLLPIEI